MWVVLKDYLKLKIIIYLQGANTKIFAEQFFIRTFIKHIIIFSGDAIIYNKKN